MTQPSPQPGNLLTTLSRIAIVLGLLYVFLLSIGLMGASFKLFGKPFADALIKGCSDPITGLFIGILATGLIQSSSTTTSLVVGFVGGGVLPLRLAVPIVMGANIGTTITNILVSFGFVTRKEDFRRAFAGATVHDFFNLCAVVTLFPIEVRFHIIERLAVAGTRTFETVGGVKFTSPLKAILAPVEHLVIDFFTHVLKLGPALAGGIVVGLSLATLIASLIFLVKALRAFVLAKSEKFINKYLFRNDLTALGLGAVLTVMVQSSSVTTSLIIPLVGAGVVTLRRCYPYTLGANIGTTCTALLAALATVQPGPGGNVGVTAAFAHLIFNTLGICIFYPLKAIPMFLATKLAALAAESKRWAIVFVIGVFFVVPFGILMLLR